MKSRALSRILWVTAAVVLVILIGYLTYSCRSLNGTDIDQSYFSNKKFTSEDNNTYIRFAAGATSLRLKLNDTIYNGVAISDYYENMIFFEIDGESYIAAVIDESTIFLSNARMYLYYDE